MRSEYWVELDLGIRLEFQLLCFQFTHQPNATFTTWKFFHCNQVAEIIAIDSVKVCVRFGLGSSPVDVVHFIYEMFRSKCHVQVYVGTMFLPMHAAKIIDQWQTSHSNKQNNCRPKFGIEHFVWKITRMYGSVTKEPQKPTETIKVM